MGAVFPAKGLIVSSLLLIVPCNLVTSPKPLGSILLFPGHAFPSAPQCLDSTHAGFAQFSNRFVLLLITGLCTRCSSIWRISLLLISLPQHHTYFTRRAPASINVNSTATFWGNFPSPSSLVSSSPRFVVLCFMLISQFEFTGSLWVIISWMSTSLNKLSALETATVSFCSSYIPSTWLCAQSIGSTELGICRIPTWIEVCANLMFCNLLSMPTDPALCHPPWIFTNLASDFDLRGQVYEGLREFLAFAGICEDPDKESGHPCWAVSLCICMSLSW